MGSTLAAAAEMTVDVATRVVHFADLDLTRSAGVAVLYARIKSAARQVCEPINDRDVSASQAARKCVDVITIRIARQRDPTTGAILAERGRHATECRSIPSR